MLIGSQRHLALAVGAPHTRALDRDTAPAERHLSILVTVPNRRPVRVVLALHADDVGHLLFHQLGQNAEPDAHAEGEQALSRCPDQLPERLLDTLRQYSLITGRLRDRYGLIHGGASLIFPGSPRTLPTEADAAGGTAVKFYELRDNPSATC
jgi:hypothetical protein